MSECPRGEVGGSSANVSRDGIEEQAAMWVLMLTGRGEPNDTQVTEFHRWLRTDPRHASEYRVQLAIAHMGRDLSVVAQTRERAGRRHRSGDSHVLSFRRIGVAVGALAAALVLVSVGIWMSTRTGPVKESSYSTRTAETRSIRLADGSLIELNSRTRVQWFLSREDRRVDLLDGEIYIDVARDTRRPFRVRVGKSEIRAIGTRFDVYKKNPDTVVLTVTEGTVQVATYEPANPTATWIKQLSAPRKIEYRSTGLVQEDDNSADALKWRYGLVQFREKPLVEAVEELRRYTDRRVVVDQRLVSAHVGGLYSTHDVTGDLKRMAQFLPMTVHDDGSVVSLDFKGQKTSDDR